MFGGMSNVGSVDEEKVHTMMRGRMKSVALLRRGRSSRSEIGDGRSQLVAGRRYEVRESR